VGLGTEQTFELSITYDIPILAEKPDLEMYMIDGDGVQMPESILRD
jgi:hypothetical protein